MERKRHKVTWMQVYNLQGTHSTHIQMYMYGKIKGTYTCGTFLGKQIVIEVHLKYVINGSVRLCLDKMYDKWPILFLSRI